MADLTRLTANRKVIRALPVQLTPTELVEQARRLADLTQEIQNAEDLEKQRKAEAKGAIARLQTERNAVCQIVSSGRRVMDVECTLYFDYTAKRAILIRDDTGDEIENRRLTDSEAQTQFTFDDPQQPELAPVAVEAPNLEPGTPASDEQLAELEQALTGQDAPHSPSEAEWTDLGRPDDAGDAADDEDEDDEDQGSFNE